MTESYPPEDSPERPAWDDPTGPQAGSGPDEQMWPPGTAAPFRPDVTEDVPPAPVVPAEPAWSDPAAPDLAAATDPGAGFPAAPAAPAAPPPGMAETVVFTDPLAPLPATGEGAGPGGQAGSPSTAQQAKEQAAGVAQRGAEAGQRTADVARQQAGQVADEAKRQGISLLRQAQDELGQQAADGQSRLAERLRTLADELTSMADGSGHDGMAADLARQAASRLHTAGTWLGSRTPADVTAEVESFARRRPGAFIALAAAAGLAAGRLTRGLKDAGTDDSSASAGGWPGAGGQP